MAYRSSNPYLFRLSARLIVFGLWIVLFGLLILYFSLQMVAVVAETELDVLTAGAGMGLDQLFVNSTTVLVHGGFVTLGLGGVMMAFGGMFIISIAR